MDKSQLTLTHGKHTHDEINEWRVLSLSPEIKDTKAVDVIKHSRESLLFAYGVLPTLSSDAATIRESQRHLLLYTLKPLANIISKELTDKLESPVSLDLTPLQASDSAARARAIGSYMTACVDAGLSAAEIKNKLSLAEQLTDWS